MKKFELKRLEIIQKLSCYILDNGLKEASLRKIASAIDTSDRMLLHYFKDKEDLISSSLDFTLTEFIKMLELSPIEPKPVKEIIPYFYTAMRDSRIRPYINLWFELLVFSIKKEEPYFTIAKQIGRTFYQRVKSGILLDENEIENEKIIAFSLALVEGFVMLDILEFDDIIESALGKLEWLTGD